MYLATCLKVFCAQRHFSLSLDGLRAGGEKILLFALYAPLLRRACWLPPQAWHEFPHNMEFTVDLNLFFLGHVCVGTRLAVGFGKW